MSQPKISVVLTTINNGEVLNGYCEKAEKEGYKEDVRFIVIIDKKTPSGLHDTCNKLIAKGFNIRCPDLLSQEFFLHKTGPMGFLVPYNTDNRRNIGYLMALEFGDEIIYSIDDDNFAETDSNVFREIAHAVGENQETIANGKDGWLNICEMLNMNTEEHIFPRGFPYSKRDKDYKIGLNLSQFEEGRVVMNAGLWLSEPDLDAVTWLSLPRVRATRFRGLSFTLGKQTWTPINTQNTALHREVMPAYYFTRMGYPLAGMPIDRYGDIFSGYLSQACVKHMGHRIRIGTPVADHRRNAHNYLQDLQGELACILVLEDFLDWLPGVKLQGSTYSETYLCLADMIEHQVQRFRGSIWTDATRGYFHQMAYCMRQWIAACKNAGG